METQDMKRDPASFFASCRKGLIVALLVTNLSGCAIFDDGYAAMGFIVWTAPISVPIMITIGVPVLIIAGAISAVEDSIEAARSAKVYNAAQAQKPLVQKARAYLKTACEQDERLFIKPGITLGEDNKILILRREDAPLPLLKTAPKEAAPAALIKFRTSYRDEFRFQSTRRFREIQYGYSIPWDDRYTLRAAWKAFPESTAAERKFFIETGKGKYIQRASKAFWEQAGLGERVIKESPTFEYWFEPGDPRPAYPLLYNASIYKDASEQRPFDLPIDAPPSTKYALSIEDISTLEDRAHWVARGRLRLIERESGETVAEYVGFAANLNPGWQTKSPSRRWDNYYRESASQYKIVTELCPNAAKEPDEIVRSFLQKILDAKSP